MYHTFEHTADIGLSVRAATLEGLFAEAGRGLFSILCANLDAVGRVRTLTFDMPYEEGAWDDLLFDYLAELLYTFNTRRVLLTQFEILLNDGRLRAVAHGETFDPARHALDMDVKAITYHGLKVVPEAEGWLAEVIVDL